MLVAYQKEKMMMRRKDSEKEIHEQAREEHPAERSRSIKIRHTKNKKNIQNCRSIDELD